MSKFLFNAEIIRGDCTVTIEAKSEKDAIEKAKKGDILDVESNGWEYGEIDYNSCQKEE